MGIRILLVEDRKEFRESLRSFLEKERDFEIVGEAEDGRRAVEKTEELRPEVVIMDVVLPELGGIEATRLIKKKFPETKVLALSIYSDKELVAEMFKAGASAYVSKENVFEELTKAIRLVSSGRFYLSPSLRKRDVLDLLQKLERKA